MSPAATFSAVPEGFGADPLSPGFSSGVPSRTVSLKLGNGGHVRQYRNNHKRGGGAGSSSALYTAADFEDEEELGTATGIAAGGLSAGIALSPGTAVMDEESQEHLSTNKKTLADMYARYSALCSPKIPLTNYAPFHVYCRLSRKNYRGGRATPEVGSDELEGTRHGLSSSLCGSVGSHSNLSSHHSLGNSNHSHSNHSHSSLNYSNQSQSQSRSQNGSNSQPQYTTSFASSFPYLSSGATSQGSASQGGPDGSSLFELAAAQASLSGANKSTLSSRALHRAVEIKAERGAARSQNESTTASTSGSGTGMGMDEEGSEGRGEEDGDDNSSNHLSQQSGEYLCFPMYL